MRWLSSSSSFNLHWISNIWSLLGELLVICVDQTTRGSERRSRYSERPLDFLSYYIAIMMKGNCRPSRSWDSLICWGCFVCCWVLNTNNIIPAGAGWPDALLSDSGGEPASLDAFLLGVLQGEGGARGANNSIIPHNKQIYIAGKFLRFLLILIPISASVSNRDNFFKGA